MKTIKIIIIILVIAVGCVVLVGWILTFMNFDVSKESFQRDYYKNKLEGMEEYRSLCELFHQHQFSGTVSVAKINHTGTLEITLDPSSDSIFFRTDTIYNYAGGPDCIIGNSKIIFYTPAGAFSNTIDEGDKVSKSKDADLMIFIHDKEQITCSPYFTLSDVYKSCTDLDTMNVQYNYEQFQKYNKLSRVSKSLEGKTMEYLKKHNL